MHTQQKPCSPLVGSERYFLSSEQPLEFTKGQDFEVFDQYGNRYLDFVCGMGPVILGHSNPCFNESLYQALQDGLSFPGYGHIHTRLAASYEAQQPNKRVVSFFKTSSEAVTAALRFSMQITQRKQILRCGFLGWHDAQIYNTPSWHEPLASSRRSQLRYQEGFRGTTEQEAAHNWTDLKLETLNCLLKKEGHRIAVFAIDIYQLAFMSHAVFAEAVSLCRHYGIQILYDETKTAGRTNPVGYLTGFSLQPDYYVLGKAIANGLPLAVLLGDEAHLEVYKEARVGGTHSKEALSAAAAQITLDLMKQEKGYERVCKTGVSVCETFNAAAAVCGVSQQVQARALFNGALFDLHYEEALMNHFTQRAKLKAALFNNKVLLLDGHCSFINLAHEKMDFTDLSKRFVKSLYQWRKGG